MNLFRKVFASVTILAMAVVTLAPAGFASAATVSAGDLVKSDNNSAVYYFGTDGKRHAFPTEATYKTWYSDFSTVKTVTVAELTALGGLGSNITFRPGTYLLKITTDPKVYAVGPGGSLLWVKTEAAAKTLFGNDWAKMVKDMPDAFFAGNYNVTSMELDGTVHPTMSVFKYASSADVYLLDTDGKKRKFTQGSFAANGYMDMFVTTSPDSITYPNGADITGKEAGLWDVAQLGASTTPTPGTSTGTLTVALASDTPAATDVPCGATPGRDIKFTKVNFTATSGDVKMTSLKVKRTGLSADTDFAGVKLFDSAMNQVGTTQTFDANHQAKFTFNWTIPTGQTLPLWISGDCAANTTGRMILGVDSASDIVSDAKSVTGNFAVTGMQQTGVDVAVGSLNVERGPQDPTTTSLDVDEKDFRFMQVRLTAGSTEGVDVKTISFKTGDSSTFSNDDLTNMRLYNDTTGTKVADLVWNGEKLTHVFNPPISLEKGDFVDLSLKADIAGGAAKTAGFQLIDDSDWMIYATGKQYGFGVSISPNATTGVDFGGTVTNAETEAFLISAGKLIVSKGPNSPATGDIPVGGSSVKLASFMFDVIGEEIRISSTAIELVETAGFDADVDATLYKLVDSNGKILAGPFDAVGTTVTFSSQINLPIGQNELFLTAKIATSGLASGVDKIQARINTPVTALTTVKGIESNDAITPSPAAIVSANTMTAKSAALVMTMGADPIAGNLVINGKDTWHASLRLDATSGGEDVKATSLTVKGSGDGSFTAIMSDFSNFKLWDGSTQIGETEQCATNCTTNGGTVVFNIDNGFVVPHNEIKTLRITSDPIGMSAGETTAFDVSAGQGVGVESGVSVTADATSTTNSPTQIWNTAGTLKVTVDGNTPVAQQVAAGISGLEVARYKFRTEDEAVDITKLTLFAAKDTSGTVEDGTDDFTAVSDNVSANTVGVKIYKGATLLGSSLFGTDGKANFNFNSGDFRIEDGIDAVITIKVDLAVKGQLNSGDHMFIGIGNDSGAANLASTWNQDTNSAANDLYEITANGVSSGSAVTSIDSNQTGAGTIDGGNPFVMYDGVLTLSLNSLSPSGTYTQGTNSEVLRIDLKATGDEITVDELAFKKTGSCVIGPATVGGTTQGEGEARWEDVTGSTVYWLFPATDNSTWLSADRSTEAQTGANEPNALTIGAGETKTVRLMGDTESSTACAVNTTLQYTIDGTVGTVVSGVEWADQQSAEVDSTFTETLPLAGNSLRI